MLIISLFTQKAARAAMFFQNYRIYTLSSHPAFHQERAVALLSVPELDEQNDAATLASRGIKKAYV